MVDFYQTPRFQLPSNTVVNETMCVTVTIPNDPEYLSMFIGHIDALKWSKNFAHDDTREGAANTSRTWQRALESSPMEVVGCEMPNFRVNEDTCLVEVDCSGDGSDWKPVATAGYDPSRDGEVQTLYPDGAPVGESVQCLAAENITEFIKQGTGQFSELVTGWLSPVFGEIVLYLYSMLSGLITAIQANIWVTVLDVDWSLFDYGDFASDYAAFDWGEFRDLIVCYVSPDGTITVLNHISALNDMESMTGQIWRFIRMVWSLAGSVGISYASRWANIETGDCASCGSWYQDFDLEVSTDDWSVRPTYSGTAGNWVSGQGWLHGNVRHTTSTIWRRGVYLGTEIEGTRITRVRVTYDMTKGSYYSSSSVALQMLLDGSPVKNVSYGAMPNGEGLEFDWSGDIEASDIKFVLWSSLSASGAYSGSVRCYRIEVWGEGDNPFV